MANMLSMPSAAMMLPKKPVSGDPSLGAADYNVAPPATSFAAPKPNALATAPTAPPQQSPYAAAMAPKPKQNGMLQAGLDGFMRGFRPEQWQADQDKTKADGAERAKQTLALMQQQRQIPAEQRAQWWQQNADQIGQIVGADVKSLPMDANSFSDQALDGQIAMISAKLGIAPEKPEADKYQFLQGPDGSLSVGNQRTGEIDQRITGTPKPTDPVKLETIQGKDGRYYSFNPYTTETKPLDVYGRVPGEGGAGGVAGAFRTMSPEEVRMRGYSPGTVVQVDGRGKEYVNARPSTAQTGQPTESERAAGLHTQVSLNGLRTIMSMEGGGYNRAGMLEQGAGAIGGVFGQGEKEKLYDQGAAEFIDGYLRAMTGAAATKSEIDTYRAQWFPQFGDSAPVMQQKARGRLNALEGMKSKAGRAWNPTWDGMITDLRNQLGTTSGQSANPMQMTTEAGSQTVPGLNWDQANMGTRETPQPTMSQDEMDELQQLRAEFGVQ